MSSYASALQEYPDIDNGNWHKPIFDSLYISQKPSIFARALNALGIKRLPYTVDLFKHLLEEVVLQRESPALTGEIVQKIFPGSDEQIVIFGDLQGAFHSCIRDLQKLVQLNVLSEDLKVSEGNYIVFNGNVINGSPYNMETLFLVLQLMKRNPSQIIYIKGAKEQYDQIFGSELMHQLRKVWGDTDVKQVELLLEKFFNTLPTALYIMQDDAKGIRIDANITSLPLDQRESSTFFTTNDKPWIMSVNGLSKEKKPIEIVANITVDNTYKKIGFKRHLGREISSWAIFSSPSASNRVLNSFLNDAFAIIETAPFIENWNITFYYHDALKSEHFESPSTYNLIKGDLLYGKSLDFFDNKDREYLKQEVIQLEARVQELKEECQKKHEQITMLPEVTSLAPEKKLLAAVHDDVIVFGCTLDLSKGVRNQSISLQAGIMARINDINAAGGISGKQIQLVFLDDQYTPKMARDNILQFITDFNTDIILSPIGSPTLENYLDLVREEKILVLFPITGGYIFRSPELRNIIHFRPSYTDELQALTEYLVTNRNAKKFLIFYQHDSYGTQPKDAIVATLKRLNITHYTQVPYERNDLDLAEQVKKIKDFDPDSIAFISTPVPAENLIRQLGTNFFIGKNIYGTSNNFGEASFRTFMQLKGLDFYVANVVPNPLVSDIEIAREFRNKAQKMNIIVDTIAFEGYIMASLTIYILEQIKPPFSQEKIINFVRNIKDLDFKGLHLSFDIERNSLSTTLWISEGFNEKWASINLKPIDQWDTEKKRPVSEAVKENPQNNKEQVEHPENDSQVGA
jgi:ABC-type branched-subunit amino acid transport system substrate-binding protein